MNETAEPTLDHRYQSLVEKHRLLLICQAGLLLKYLERNCCLIPAARREGLNSFQSAKNSPEHNPGRAAWPLQTSN